MGIFKRRYKEDFNEKTDKALDEYKQIRQGTIAGTRYSSVDEMMKDILGER